MPLHDEFEPFPVAGIPGACGEYITEVARAIGCDPCMIAVPLLVSVAAAVGNTRTIDLGNRWHEPSIIWASVVSSSGTHKTPAMRAALKPFRSYDADLASRNSAEHAEHKAAMQEHEKKLAAWKRSSSSGPAPVEPEAKGARRYIVSDITTEALAGILRDNPRGVLLARDELAGWFGSFDRYTKSGAGGGDSAQWLSMHNAETLIIDRKTGTHPSIFVPRASVSIFGCIQPGILERMITGEHRDSGMLARFLLVQPPPRLTERDDEGITSDAERRVVLIFQRLLNLRPNNDTHSGRPEPVPIPLSPEAKAFWRTHERRMKREVFGLVEDDLKAAGSKMVAYAARLALLIHLIRSSEWGDVDAMQIDETSVVVGCALADWFWRETLRIYSMRAESKHERDIRIIAEWIKARGGEVTVRDLTHGMRRYRNKSEEAEQALAALVANGNGIWNDNVPGATHGLPSRRFRLIRLPRDEDYDVA